MVFALNIIVHTTQSTILLANTCKKNIMHIMTALFKYCASTDLDRNVNAVSHTHTNIYIVVSLVSDYS